MLFLYGLLTVDKDWHVKEISPASYCRVYYVHGGNVVYRDEHTVRQLRTDCLYIFPSTLPYEMVQDPEDPLSCLFLHIDVSPKLLHHLVEIEVKEDTFLMYLLKTMEVWIKEHPFVGVDIILEALSNTFAEYLNKEKLLQSVPDKIAETISYITEHVQEKITVETLSSLCGYHSQYYISLFCAHMGITPHQYLIRHRMKLALHELMVGKSVSETSDNVGYPEVRNFIRAFKKYYGFPPRQVRKMIQP